MAQTAAEAVSSTSLPFPKRSGKVRDVYDLGTELLIVATDRISAYDVVMNDPIPAKGVLLTQMSVFWFALLKSAGIDHHLITADYREYPKSLHPFGHVIANRSMLVKKTRVVPIECVARGYLAGSGWAEYQKSQTVCNLPLPPGLTRCQKLPTPIFTPATKAETGHDENISFAQMAAAVGSDTAHHLQDLTLKIYNLGYTHALARGIIIADTKFEFGHTPDGNLILIDEVLTPDSSRFWPVDSYHPGQDQPSFDKQFLRNYLESLKTWPKSYPPPPLPQEVIEGTLQRYLQAKKLITGA
jgi:phosphoribosylaminoimidazole-succinocarboxamide synthase